MHVPGTTSREIGALHWSVAMLAWVCFGGIAIGQHIAVSRGEATVLIEPYATNVVRMSLSLRRDDALAGPGYGISAKAAGTGWVAESSEIGDVLRSSRMVVTVTPVGRRGPESVAGVKGTQADIAKFFNGSTPGMGISIKTPDGASILEMQGWQMSVPNHKDGNADILYDRRPTDVEESVVRGVGRWDADKWAAVRSRGVGY